MLKLMGKKIFTILSSIFFYLNLCLYLSFPRFNKKYYKKDKKKKEKCLMQLKNSEKVSCLEKPLYCKYICPDDGFWINTL